MIWTNVEKWSCVRILIEVNMVYVVNIPLNISTEHDRFFLQIHHLAGRLWGDHQNGELTAASHVTRTVRTRLSTIRTIPLSFVQILTLMRIFHHLLTVLLAHLHPNSSPYSPVPQVARERDRVHRLCSHMFQSHNHCQVSGIVSTLHLYL